MCLAGETEVVTRDGIRAIRDLAGTTPELLVPKMANGSTSEIGHFVEAPVRSFGVQKLWRVDLAGHGRSTKTVYATGNHRWFLTPKRPSSGVSPHAVLTSELRTGDRLRNLFRCPIGEVRGDASNVAAMRGFVFGDGSVGSGERPGLVMIYGAKRDAFNPIFTACFGEGVESENVNGCPVTSFYGIPNYWKSDFPSLRESRHYLMGWLSGWFAADGCISEAGVCILNSATREHLEFARSLCAVLGVQCSAVRTQNRLVTPPSGVERSHDIHTVNINRHHLTADFFRLTHHQSHAATGADRQVRRYGWTVASVTETDRTEEVFCAVVEGVGAFGLSDGLMTGNCMLKSLSKRVRIMSDRPDLAAWWLDRDKISGGFSPGNPTYAQLARRASALRLPMVVDDETELCSGGGCTD